MLSERSTRCLHGMLSFGSWLGFLPYKWDPIQRQLTKASKTHVLLSNVHHLLAFLMMFFAGGRLALSFRPNASPVPDHIQILAFAWAQAYVLENVCWVQFHVNHEQIRTLTNALLRLIKEAPKKATPQLQWPSRCLFLSIGLLVVNPPVHAAFSTDTPCGPHMLGSIILPCENATDQRATLLQRLPFFCLETYFTGKMLYLYSFNWTIIFLALVASRTHLKERRIGFKSMEVVEWTLREEASRTYRHVQTLAAILRESFKYFFAWFNFVLLSLVTVLTFASLRFFRGLSYRSYLQFPACSFRCAFESYTLLILAGMLNEESGAFILEWRLRTRGLNRDKWTNRFLTSCPKIKCNAGSFYTLENSILLTTLSNTAEQTSNLLVMYQ